MRQNFGVGIGAKICVAFLNELLLEHLIIFNHAVVDERDFARGIEMRVGVFISDFSVRRPAGVTDAIRSGGGFFGNQFGQRGDSPGAFSSLDLVAVYDRDAGGIVAAVFEATKTIEQNGRCFGASNVTNDATN